MAGTYDSATGQVWYESRTDRIECETESRCGWNRHTRMYGNLNGDDLEDLSFAYSNIQAPPGQDGFQGLIITANGDLTDGIKPRLWQATNGSGGAPTGMAHYQTVGNWVEVSNTSCFTGSSETASTCETGLGIFTDNTKFVMDGNETQAAAWFAAQDGQDFTAVVVNTDVQ